MPCLSGERDALQAIENPNERTVFSQIAYRLGEDKEGERKSTGEMVVYGEFGTFNR